MEVRHLIELLSELTPNTQCKYVRSDETCTFVKIDETERRLYTKTPKNEDFSFASSYLTSLAENIEENEPFNVSQLLNNKGSNRAVIDSIIAHTSEIYWLQKDKSKYTVWIPSHPHNVGELCEWTDMESLALLQKQYKGKSSNMSMSTLNYPLQQIFYGAPGTGKSYKTNEVAKKYSTIRTTFHPDSDYSTFVGAYKPTTIKDNRYVMDGSNPIAMKYPDNDEKESRRGAFIKESKIEYRFVKQAFLKSYINAWKLFAVVDNEEVKPQFLIIEEINRGNCAQIFGDLFQLLDRKDGFSEYPIEADEDIRKSLISEDTEIDPSFGEKGLQFTDTQKDAINAVFNKDEDTPFRNVADDIACGKVLVLPPNFYIWATMNTSDQSLFPIDSAFKRRWDWKYVRICEGKKKDGSPLNYRIRFTIPEIDGKPAETVDEKWWDFVKAINKQIEEATKSEDKKLGFFFCKPDKKANDADESNTIISAETFVGKVVFYLWQDVFKDYGFKSDIFKNGDKKISFHDFYPEDMIADETTNPERIDLALVKTFIYKVIGKKEDKTSEATTEA